MIREGTDGLWSTFSADIGDPPQRISLLPAISISGTRVFNANSCLSSLSNSCPIPWNVSTFDDIVSHSWKPYGETLRTVLVIPY